MSWTTSNKFAQGEDVEAPADEAEAAAIAEQDAEDQEGDE